MSKNANTITYLWSQGMIDNIAKKVAEEGINERSLDMSKISITSTKTKGPTSKNVQEQIRSEHKQTVFVLWTLVVFLMCMIVYQAKANEDRVERFLEWNTKFNEVTDVANEVDCKLDHILRQTNELKIKTDNLNGTL